MKKLLQLLLFFLSALMVNAQDIIVLTDGTTIQSKVLTVTSSSVQYKKWSNLDGPTYTHDISGILAINYQNGTKDQFNTTSSQSTAPETDYPSSTVTAEQTSAATPSIVTGEIASFFSDDGELVRRYNSQNYEMFVKKAKIGTIMAIGGGVLTVGGIIVIFASMSGESGTPQTGFAIGLPVSVVGAGIGAWGLIMRRQNTKLMNMVSSYSIWKDEFKLDSQRSMSLGIDVLHDYVTQERGLGVGVCLNF